MSCRHSPSWSNLHRPDLVCHLDEGHTGPHECETADTWYMWDERGLMVSSKAALRAMAEAMRKATTRA